MLRADEWSSRKMFIQEDKTRRVWGVTLGLAAGLLLGGSVASVENRACAQSDTPAGYCLTETPQVRVVNGMVGGAFAAGGALLMLELWGRSQRSN